MLDDHGTRPTQLQLPTPLRLNGEGRITILIQRPSFHSILFFAVTAGLLQAYLDQRTGTPAAWTLVAAYGACILIAVAAGEFVRRVFRDLRGPRMIAAAVGLVGPGLTAWSSSEATRLWVQLGATSTVLGLTLLAEIGFRCGGRGRVPDRAAAPAPEVG